MKRKIILIISLLFGVHTITLAQFDPSNLQPTSKIYERLVQSNEVKELTSNTFMSTQIIDLRLRHVDVTNGRLLNFTMEDAKKLEQYFLAQDGILLCKSHYLDKSVQIVNKYAGVKKNLIDPDALTDELKIMGFMIYDFKMRNQKVLFHGITDCDLQDYANVHKFRINKDCDECGEVELSEQLIEKFKNVDYGGQAIQFNLDEIEPMAIDTSFTSSDRK